eukprot:gene8509-11503_t
MSSISIPVSFEELESVSYNNWFCENQHIEWDKSKLLTDEQVQEICESCNDYESLHDFNFEFIGNLYLMLKDWHSFSNTTKEEIMQTILHATSIIINFTNENNKNSSANSHNSHVEKNQCMKVLFLFLQLCVIADHSSLKSSVAHNVVGKPSKTVEKKKTTKSNLKKTQIDSDNEEEDTNNQNFDNSSVWNKYKQSCLEQMVLILNQNLSIIFNMGMIPEQFINGFWIFALHLLDQTPVGKTGRYTNPELCIRSLCCQIISKCASLNNNGSKSNYNQNDKYEINAEIDNNNPNYTLSCMLYDKLINKSSPQLVKDISEIYTISSDFLMKHLIAQLFTIIPSQTSSEGLNNLSDLIENIAKKNPLVFHHSFPILVLQLDSPAHQIRSAVINSMGYLINYYREIIDINHTTGEQQDSTNDENSNDNDDNNNKIDAGNRSNLIRIRDKMIKLLIERTHDSNQFTRANVLKTWSYLIETKSIPVRQYTQIADVAIDRLHDKIALVRKNSIVLLTTLLDFNPFSGNLNQDMFQLQFDELKIISTTRIQELFQSYKINNPELFSSTIATGADDHNNDKNALQIAEEKEAYEEFSTSRDVLEDSIVSDVNQKLEFIGNALELSSVISNIIPSSAHQLLQSKNMSDVIEILKFFTRAINFNIKGSINGFKHAFSLIWHQEPKIVLELLNSFRSVYLTDGSIDNNPLSGSEIAINLTRLVTYCQVEAEMTSLEHIIGELFKEKQVNSNVIESLFELASSKFSQIIIINNMKSNNTSELGSVIRVISMVSNHMISSIKTDHILAMIKYGLSDIIFEKQDISSMKSFCLFIQAFPSFLQSISHNSNYLNTQFAQSLLESTNGLVKIIMGYFCNDKDDLTSQWFHACEEAIHALFHIHPNPDKIICHIIYQLYSNLSSATEANTINGKVISSTSKLAQLLFILGQTAVCTVVYTEAIAVLSKKYTPKTILENNVSDENIMDNEADNNEVDAMEEEMGMAAAADADHERILNVTIEQELVLKNLLGKFKQFVAYIVANENHNYDHILIRQSSVLALCRMMSVSSLLCESSLPLMFTVLEHEKSEQVRTSIIIAMGDLAFRFPNCVEPWTDRLYSRLSDESVMVRYNTLMVITHLVLNDMIKVKGQVSQVVLSLNDPDERISDLAKLFFIKLSERSNNPVYNLLGDIISTFSQEKASESNVNSSSGSGYNNHMISKTLSTEEFESTMQFLLSFVHKESKKESKQADTLLERLLMRIGIAEGLRQRRNLAFCVSQLYVTEKGVKKMVDLIKNIKDALYDEEIFNHFKTTLMNAKRSTKSNNMDGSTQTSIEEFENLLSRINDDRHGVAGSDDNGNERKLTADENDEIGASESQQDNNKSVVVKKGKKEKNVASKKASTRKKVVKKYDEEEEEGEEDEEDYDNTENVNNNATQKSTTNNTATKSNSRKGRNNSSIIL